MRWTRARWRTVLFSGESCFLMSRGAERTRVYTCRGERYAPNCMQQIDRFDSDSVMVWVGSHNGGRAVFVHVEGAVTRSCIITSFSHYDRK